MAVTITGTLTTWNTSADGSQAITVPTDADAVIVIISGYDSAGSQDTIIDNLDFDNTLNGNDFTSIATALYGASLGIQTSAYYMLSSDGNWPGTGSKTIYWSHNHSYSYGYVMTAFYVKGLNLTTPIGATDERPYTGNNWTSALSACPAGDLGVIVTSGEAATPNMAPTSSGQTSLVSSALFNSLSLGIGYEDGETALQAEGTGLVPVAFVLQASASSALTTVTDTLALTTYKANIDTLTLVTDTLALTTYPANIDTFTYEANAFFGDSFWQAPFWNGWWREPTVVISTITDTLALTTYPATVSTTDSDITTITDTLALTTYPAGIYAGITLVTDTLVLTSQRARIVTGEGPSRAVMSFGGWKGYRP